MKILKREDCANFLEELACYDGGIFIVIFAFPIKMNQFEFPRVEYYYFLSAINECMIDSYTYHRRVFFKSGRNFGLVTSSVYPKAFLNQFTPNKSDIYSSKSTGDIGEP